MSAVALPLITDRFSCSSHSGSKQEPPKPQEKPQTKFSWHGSLSSFTSSCSASSATDSASCSVISSASSATSSTSSAKSQVGSVGVETSNPSQSTGLGIGMKERKKSVYDDVIDHFIEEGTQYFDDAQMLEQFKKEKDKEKESVKGEKETDNPEQDYSSSLSSDDDDEEELSCPPNSPQIPMTVSKPILKTGGKTLLQPDCQVGSRIRLRSVDMRDIRYYHPNNYRGDDRVECRVNTWELDMLNKLSEISYDVDSKNDLVINFLRLYLLNESIRDHWIIDKRYASLISGTIEEYGFIMQMKTNHNELLLGLCQRKAEAIYLISSKDILATKIQF